MEPTIRIKHRKKVKKRFSLYKMATNGTYYTDIDHEFLQNILMDQERLKRYINFIVGSINR